MLGPLILIGLILATFALLYLRYLALQRRMKEAGSGSVQYTGKMEPPKLDDDLFLPGSRLGERMDGRPSELANLEVTPEVNKPKKRTARRRGIIRDRADIRRSYIVDALLERPKF
ncbi:MAG: hypothetical protein AAF804_17795 [Bacteroidota bacterium]